MGMGKNYVLGFAFSADRSKLVLIRKNRPDWQAGKLNGVGGKIEPFDANGQAAMCREFREETGVETQPGDWYGYAELTADFGHVSVYQLVSDIVLQAVTRTDEEVCLYDADINDLRQTGLSNVAWLAAMALDTDIKTMTARIHYEHQFINAEKNKAETL